MINARDRRCDEEQTRAVVTTLHERQTISVVNLASFRMQEVRPMTSRAAEAPELPKRIGARVPLVVRAAQRDDEHALVHVGLRDRVYRVRNDLLTMWGGLDIKDGYIHRSVRLAGKRLLAYQTLLYTGQRKSEVRALVWGDLHLDGEEPYALFREGTMKDKDKRAVPLRKELAEGFRAARPANVDPTQKVFWFAWPTYDILRGDFIRAGIERKDALGRVVHFHSFRKTLQTLGVRSGVNQRAAQEILGHSDANLTAQVYTDVPSLQLHREIAKLPWISSTEVGAQHGAQNSCVSRLSVSLADICAQLIEAVKLTEAQSVSHALASSVTSRQNGEMAARAGIEPVTK